MKRLAALFAIALVGCATTETAVHPASYLASSFGSLMTLKDHAQANNVLEGGSEDLPVSWVDPTTGRRFTVTPTRTFKRGDADCRDYAATFGGRTVKGSACRRDDGTWLR